MKTVSELCKQIKGIYNVEGNVETPITGIAADSREIEPGNLFVCISGVHVDGASCRPGCGKRRRRRLDDEAFGIA